MEKYEKGKKDRGRQKGFTDVREKFDKIIIGAGLYGLYAALYCGVKKQKVIVLECDA